MKTCVACGETKQLEEFGRDRPYRRMKVSEVPESGFSATCKSCVKRLGRQRYYQANPQRFAANRDDWRQRNPERRKEVARDYARRQRWQRLGITAEIYERLLADSQNVCCGCLRAFGRQVPACVDHDHVTGAPRGLLCHLCNLSIGYAKDEPERLRRLADYLERSHG